jgi:hypothetical protein
VILEGCRYQVSGYRIQDTRYKGRMQVSGCKIQGQGQGQDEGYRIKDTSRRMGDVILNPASPKN